METIEDRLVEKAKHLNPRELRRLARRALAAVESDRAVVDAHEDALVREEERHALARPASPSTTTTTAPSPATSRCPPLLERS